MCEVWDVHDDVIKWKHFSRYWPFVQGIHRSPANSSHTGQWRRALIFSLIFAWINSWENSCEGVDLRHHCAHYDVTIMLLWVHNSCSLSLLYRMLYDIILDCLVMGHACIKWQSQVGFHFTCLMDIHNTGHSPRCSGIDQYHAEINCFVMKPSGFFFT